MSRTRKLLPRYLSHPSGRGRAVWNDPTGRREKMLPGEFNSPESLQAFAKLQLELASSPEMPARTSNGPTVVESAPATCAMPRGTMGPVRNWKRSRQR